MINYPKKRLSISLIISALVYWIIITAVLAVLFHPYLGILAGYISVSVMMLIFAFITAYLQYKNTRDAIDILSRPSLHDQSEREIYLHLSLRRAWLLVIGLFERDRIFKIEDIRHKENVLYLSALKSWKDWGIIFRIALIETDENHTKVQIDTYAISGASKSFASRAVDIIAGELQKNDFLNVDAYRN